MDGRGGVGRMEKGSGTRKKEELQASMARLFSELQQIRQPSERTSIFQEVVC